jgi:hypothetical protein
MTIEDKIGIAKMALKKAKVKLKQQQGRVFASTALVERLEEEVKLFKSMQDEK